MADINKVIVIDVENKASQDLTQVGNQIEEIGSKTQGSISELRQLKKELRNAAAGSDEFKRLFNEIDDLEEKIKGTKKASSDWVDSLAEAPGPLGSLGKAINAVKEGTVSFGGALKATGIGLVVAALGGLVAAFTSNEVAMKKIQPLLDGLQKILGGIFRAMEPLLDIFLEMAMTALPYVTKAVGVFYSALFGLFTFVQQAGGGFIKVLKGIGTLNFDMAKEGIDQIQSSFSKAVKAGEDAYKRFEVGSKELTKSEKEELEKRQKAADEAAAKKKAAAAKADAAEVKRKEEEAAKLKAIEDKRLADDMKSAEDAVNILNRLREATETPAQKLQREYEEEKLVLEANNLSTEELTRQHLAKLAAIKTTEETTQAEKDRVAREKKLADETALNDQLIAVEIAYQDAKRGALDTGLNILLMFAGKNKALALSILAVQKGLAIADVVVGAARSISLATQNLAQIPMVLPPGIPNPAFYVQAAATVKGIATTKITAATSIASILAAGISQASSISGGSGGGGAAAGGGGGGMAAPAPQAQFNIVGQSSNNQLAGAIATQQQQPVQAFVVGSDVTTQQALDRQKINNSTFL